MATTFDTWTVKEAKKQITDLIQTWAKVNLAFYDGDHWQGGAGWSGPMPDVSETAYNTTLLKVEQGFVSKNAIAEVTDRHMSGVVGKRPKWTLGLKRPLDDGEEPTLDEQGILDEAEELLSAWLNGQQGIAPRQSGKGIRVATVHEVVQQAVLSVLLTRRGVLRLFVSPSALTSNEAGETAVSPEDAAAIIGKIFVNNPASTQAAVVTDPDTIASCGVYVYRGTAGAEYAEICYLDEAGQTAVIIAGQTKNSKGETQETGTVWTLPLGGRLLMHEMLREELISEQVRQAQRALNKAKTMQSFNLDGAGFLERIFTNTQMPGDWEDDPDNPGEQRFIAGKFHTGAATVNFLQGTEQRDPKTGEITYATPGVHFREPGTPENFIKASEDYYRGILDEVDQLHHLMAGDAVTSGVSRQTAKDEFRASLDLTRPQVEAAMRWLLETVLAMTAVFSGNPTRYDGLKVTAECRIDLGTAGEDELRMVGEARKNGLISQQTAVARAGVDDPQAEIALIEQETAAQLNLLQQQATVIGLLIDAGASIEGAAEAVGIDAELAGKLAGRRLIPAAVPANGVVNAPA